MDIMDIGPIAITYTGLTDISAGAADITGVGVMEEAMAAGGMAGAAEALAGAETLAEAMGGEECMAAEVEILAAVGGMAGAADTAAADTDVSGDVFVKDALKYPWLRRHINQLLKLICDNFSLATVSAAARRRNTGSVALA